MKTTKLFILLTLLTGLTLSSCSSDDDNDGPTTNYTFGTKNVFTGDLVKSIDDITFKYDTDGLLISMENEEGNITTTLEYKKTSNIVSSVTMTTVVTDDPTDNVTIVFEIGTNGFATKASVKYEDEDATTYDVAFTYNTDGQLASVKKTGDWVENNIITYVDGNIDTITCTDEDGDVYVYTFKYTSEAHPKGYENVRGTMFFDDSFDLELEDVEYAYYAGILGKGTKYLPLELHVVYKNDYPEENGEDTIQYSWKLNDDNYVTEFSTVGSTYATTLSWY